jgi:hypothetical protein
VLERGLQELADARGDDDEGRIDLFVDLGEERCIAGDDCPWDVHVAVPRSVVGEQIAAGRGHGDGFVVDAPGVDDLGAFSRMA